MFKYYFRGENYIGEEIYYNLVSVKKIKWKE